MTRRELIAKSVGAASVMAVPKRKIAVVRRKLIGYAPDGQAEVRPFDIIMENGKASYICPFTGQKNQCHHDLWFTVQPA